MLTVGPMSIEPESGFSWPVIILNSVDLPAPLGPMMPMIAPGGAMKLRLSISRRSPKLLETLLNRSEEHTSELQSLMRISYAVFCLKKKKCTTPNDPDTLQAY